MLPLKTPGKNLPLPFPSFWWLPALRHSLAWKLYYCNLSASFCTLPSLNLFTFFFSYKDTIHWICNPVCQFIIATKTFFQIKSHSEVWLDMNLGGHSSSYYSISSPRLSFSAHYAHSTSDSCYCNNSFLKVLFDNIPNLKCCFFS